MYSKTETYNKTQVDSSLALKANLTDIYNRTTTTSYLALKANVIDVYSKTDTYNKTEINTSLGLLAPISTTYTKTQVDNALILKANANNADITGYIRTNNLKMLGVLTNSALAPIDTSTGFIIHPNRFRFAISNLDIPVAGEAVLTLDNTNITVGRDIQH